MAEPNLIGNAAVIQGDISHPYLGLDRGTYAGLKAGATEVLHAYRVLSQLISVSELFMAEQTGQPQPDRARL
jgi:hypothetical protein